MNVRTERVSDEEAIRRILVDVFSDMPHSEQTEHLIVDALRASGALRLSLVAEDDGCVVGHVAFSPAQVGDEREGWYVLGPLAVARDAQGRGVARALVEAGIEQLRSEAARGVVLVGEPSLYGRFGFRSVPGVDWPGVPHEYVQVLVLSGEAPRGGIVGDSAVSVSAGEGFEVLELRAGDEDLVYELLAVFGDAFEDVETYTAEQPSREYIRRLISDGDAIVLVARAGDHVVGGLVAYELRKLERERSEVYIYDLAVAESFRRRGVATALIERLKPLAKARGAWVIYVQADPPDAPAVALYSKLGQREDVLHFDIPVE